MKVLSDILHKAGILKEAAEAYSSGGYSVLVRNSTTQRLETVPSSSLVPSQTGNSGKYLTTNGSVLSWGTVTTLYTGDGSITGDRTVSAGNFNLKFTSTKNTGLYNSAIFDNTGATANRVVINHSANTGFGLSIANSLKFSNSVYSPLFDGIYSYAIYNDQLSGAIANALFINGGTNNVTIGGVTDLGYKLDVRGTGRFTLPVTLDSRCIKTANTTTAYYFQGSALWLGGFAADSTGSPSLYDQYNNKVIIGNTNWATNVNGNIIAIGMFHGGSVQSYGGILIGNSSSLHNGGGYRNDLNIIIGHSSGIGFTGMFNDGKNIVIGNNSQNTSQPNANKLTIIGNDINSNLANAVILGDTSQSVIIGAYSGLSSSAKLQIDSTTQGFLNPRMNVTQMNAIASPATGLQVYNTTSNLPFVYRGSSSGWRSLLTNETPVTFTGSNLLMFRTDVEFGYDGAIVIAQNVAKTSGYAIGNIIINSRSSFTNLTGAYNTLIGASAGKDLTTGSSNVMIGSAAGMNVTNAGTGTYIGSQSVGSLTNSNYQIQITAGDQSFSEGVASDMYPTDHSYAFIGGGSYNNNQIKHFYFGAAPLLREPFYPDSNKDVFFYAPSASQVTDKSGGNFTINAGRGTGTGTPGDVIISTATPTSTGTTIQTLTQRVWIKGNNGNVGIGASPNASYKLDVQGSGAFLNAMYLNSTSDALFYLQNSGTNRWRIGNAYVGGANYFQLFDAVNNIQVIRWNSNSTAKLYSDLTLEGSTNNAVTVQATAPILKVKAIGDTNEASLYIEPSGGLDASIRNSSGSSLLFYIGSSNYFTMLSTGQLRMHLYTSSTAFTGTAAGYLAFDASGNIITTSGTGGGGGGTPAGSSGQIQFNSSGSFGADSNLVWDNTNKRLGIGVGSPTTSIHTAGSVTATGFFESSDARLKSDILDYSGGNLASVKAKMYTKNGRTEIGYLAQDVENIYSSAVMSDATGYKHLSYREVHTAKIAALEKEIEQLKSIINGNNLGSNSK